MNKEKQIEEMAKVIDEFTEPLSARDIHKAEFSERFAEHLYTADYRKQEWISVDERLPEQANHYLTVSEEGIYVRFYSSEWGWNHDFGEVTHWMPLPEAPKMKGGE